MTTETSGRGGEDADAHAYGHGEDEDEAVGMTGGTDSGEGTWDGRPRCGRCIVVTTAHLPRAGKGGDAGASRKLSFFHFLM